MSEAISCVALLCSAATLAVAVQAYRHAKPTTKRLDAYFDCHRMSRDTDYARDCRVSRLESRLATIGKVFAAIYRDETK